MFESTRRHKDSRQNHAGGGIEHDSPDRQLLSDRRQQQLYRWHSRKKPDSRVILVGTRYYLSLARAVSETAEIALRDRIAAGEITTLQVAVEELRNIKGQIQAAISGKDVN